MASENYTNCCAVPNEIKVYWFSVSENYVLHYIYIYI